MEVCCWLEHPAREAVGPLKRFEVGYVVLEKAFDHAWKVGLHTFVE